MMKSRLVWAKGNVGGASRAVSDVVEDGRGASEKPRECARAFRPELSMPSCHIHTRVRVNVFQSKIRYLTRRDQCNSDATLTAVNLSRLMSRRIYEQAPIMVGPEMCTQCLGGPVSTHSPPSRPWNTIKATLPGFKPGIRMLMETVNWSSRTVSDSQTLNDTSAFYSYRSPWTLFRALIGTSFLILGPYGR